MKKNLKKVISAVIALALSLSSVAAFAADKSFTDVAETASYYQAVTTLANLGIISGYEDGSFKPDDNITRAEVTTMVVAAMNMKDQAESMAGTTKFPDAQSEATKWASGYINVGVAQKFIAGFEDGTFRPSENVTYAQIVTMLVGALNYGEYATYLGGYPQGYISIGQTSGVTKNVAGNAEDIVTRAQVAMLINNFLNTPKVEMGGISYTSDGRLVPTIKIQDGTDDSYYKSILTENWGIYVLEGTVTATSKSSATSNLEADEVEFTTKKDMTKNNKINGYDDPSGEDISVDGTTIVAKVGDTAAVDCLNSYVTIYAQYDENEDWVIRNLIGASAKSKSVAFNTSLADDAADGASFTVGNKYLKFYATTSAVKSTKYALADDAVLYVNGREVGALTAGDYTTYILDNNAGEVKLMDNKDASGNARADGDYDIVDVTYYATARVDSVTASSGRVSFKSYSANAAGNLKLDEEDENVDFSITYNGDEIAVTDLLEDDILTIAYDVTDFKTSDFYNIQVSRSTAEGKYSGMSKDNRTVTLGDKKYELTELSDTIGDKTTQFVTKVETDFAMVLSNEYTAYLDVNGRIFDIEILANAAKIAIADKTVSSSSYDNYGLTLYTIDGTTVTYEVDTDVTGWGTISDAKAKIGENSAKKDIWERVVQYKVNSKGYITELTQLAGTNAKADYRSNTNSIGGVRMSSATKVIDAIDYLSGSKKTSELAISNAEGFVDDTEYTVYGYGTKFSDGTFPFVLAVAGAGKYTEDTRFAVLAESVNTIVDNGEELDALTLWNADAIDEVVTLSISDDNNISSSVISGLEKGDVIVYKLDANGQIKYLDVIFAGKGLVGDYNALSDAVLDGTIMNLVAVPAGEAKWSKNWKADSDTPAQIVAGPVVEKTSSTFSIGKVAAGITDLTKVETDADGIYNVATNGDTKVYVYDYSLSSKANLTAGAVGDIEKCSNIDRNATSIDWSAMPTVDDVAGGDVEGLCVVFAKVVNGYATDVFVLKAGN